MIADIWQCQYGRANARKGWGIPDGSHSRWDRGLRLSVVVFDSNFVNLGHHLMAAVIPTADRSCWSLSKSDDRCQHVLTSCHRFSNVSEGTSLLAGMFLAGMLLWASYHHVSHQHKNWEEEMAVFTDDVQQFMHDKATVTNENDSHDVCSDHNLCSKKLSYESNFWKFDEQKRKPIQTNWKKYRKRVVLNPKTFACTTAVPQQRKKEFLVHINSDKIGIKPGLAGWEFIALMPVSHCPYGV